MKNKNYEKKKRAQEILVRVPLLCKISRLNFEKRLAFSLIFVYNSIFFDDNAVVDKMLIR